VVTIARHQTAIETLTRQAIADIGDPAARVDLEPLNASRNCLEVTVNDVQDCQRGQTMVSGGGIRILWSSARSDDDLDAQ
jgi:hypothetical protein